MTSRKLWLAAVSAGALLAASAHAQDAAPPSALPSAPPSAPTSPGAAAQGVTPGVTPSATAAAAAPTPAAEQPTAGQPGPAPADTTVDAVVVTGTRVARSRLDTLSPVDVITTNSLQQQGTPELAQQLANLAPSLDFPRPSLTDGTDAIRPATLRGLSPDETLVLVNGVRRHASALVNINGSIGRGSAAVDLDAIPSVALERVEVLRDGAAAQYGSDAIAGVINLILRKARSGGELSAQWGDYESHVDLLNADRKVSDGVTYDVSGWQGLPLGADGFLTVSGEYTHRDPTNRADYDPRITNARVVTGRYGDPALEQESFYANAGLPLAAGWEAYGFAGYQHRDTTSAAFPRLSNNANNILSIYPNGFLPMIQSSADDWTASGGVKGQFAGFNVDASATYGDNHVDFGTVDTLNASLGPSSPTSFEDGSLDYGLFTANLDVTRPITLPLARFAKPSNLAFGVEYRHETYQISPGESGSYAFGTGGVKGAAAGAQGFTGFQPSNAVDVSRDSGSAYVDLDNQITDKFEVDLAGRYEKYSDFGDTATGKVAARYDLTHFFALRGAVQSGFRAPSLQQEYFTSTASALLTVNGVSDIVLAGTFPATSATAGALGGQALKPELSTNYSAGGVFHMAGFELTVDAYRIYLYDRIVLSENLTGSNAASASLTSQEIFALLNPPGSGGAIQGARFFINGVNTRTDGIDVVSRYHRSTQDYGRFDFTLAANLNHTDVSKVPTTSAVSGLAVPPSLFARVNVLTFEKGTPQQKYVGAVDWGYGPVGVTLRGTWYASVLVPNTNPALDYNTGSHFLVDVEGRYRLPYNVTAALGVSNLSDEYPKAAPALVNTTGSTSFSSYSPFGFNGRFVYGRLSIGW